MGIKNIIWPYVAHKIKIPIFEIEHKHFIMFGSYGNKKYYLAIWSSQNKNSNLRN
jgi:hypothetical protein